MVVVVFGVCVCVVVVMVNVEYKRKNSVYFGFIDSIFCYDWF